MDTEQKYRYFVHTIESPSPKDLLYGFIEGRLLTEALSFANIYSTYHLATNYETFIEALYDRLVQGMKDTGGIPVLHISMHGNEDGIELTDKTFIDWNKLRNMLVPINNSLSGGLILCMSACFGFNGCRMAMTEGGLPFFGMVTHIGKPDLRDLAVAFVVFYHLFFKGMTVPKAVEAMRIASGDNGFREILGKEVQQGWIEFIKEEKQREMQERLKKFRAEHYPK